MRSVTLNDLDGKRALIEVREFRRMHRVVIATLVKEGDAIYAVFRESHSQHGSELAKIEIPDKYIRFFSLVFHADYDFKLQSVLLRGDSQSDDECPWVRSPIIVTQDDIDAAKSDTELNESV